jgi:glucose 1-dehydrogenase
MKLLEGRAAVVTGATSGIGRGCAQALAAAGCAVVVDFRPGSQRRAEELVAAIEQDGGRAVAVPCDVTDEGQVQGLFRAARDAFDRVHVLVANAGIQRDAPLVDMTLGQWREVIEVNLTGQFLCAREAARLFLRNQPPTPGSTRGSIVCMSSVHEFIPWSGHVNYAAAKGGVAMLMRSIAQELAPHRIRVNAVAPGAIRTRINRDAWETPEALQRLLELIPYGRIGEVDDVARAVVWLASDLADYVTGATLVVDGGMALYPGFRDSG